MARRRTRTVPGSRSATRRTIWAATAGAKASRRDCWRWIAGKSRASMTSSTVTSRSRTFVATSAICWADRAGSMAWRRTRWSSAGRRSTRRVAQARAARVRGVSWVPRARPAWRATSTDRGRAVSPRDSTSSTAARTRPVEPAVTWRTSWRRETSSQASPRRVRSAERTAMDMGPRTTWKCWKTSTGGTTSDSETTMTRGRRSWAAASTKAVQAGTSSSEGPSQSRRRTLSGVRASRQEPDSVAPRSERRTGVRPRRATVASATSRTWNSGGP